jgi:hypothetical protein
MISNAARTDIVKYDGNLNEVSKLRLQLDVKEGESVVVGDVILGRDETSLFSINKLTSERQGSQIKGTTTCSIVQWDITSGAVVKEIPIGSQESGIVTTRYTSCSQLKASKDGKRLFAVMVEGDSNMLSERSTTTIVEWDIASGEEVFQIPVGSSSAGIEGGTCVRLMKLLQARDGESLFGVVTVEQKDGLRVQGSESILRYSVTSTPEKSAAPKGANIIQIEVGKADYGLTGVQMNRLLDVKQSKDGKHLFGILSHYEKSGIWRQQTHSSIAQWAADDGTLVKCIDVGTTVSTFGLTYNILLTQLTVGRDGKSLFGILTETTTELGVGGTSSTAEIVQWDIAKGAVVQYIPTGVSFLKGIGSSNLAGIEQERLKLSKHGSYLYGIVTNIKANAGAVVGTSGLCKWEITRGTLDKSIVVAGVNAQRYKGGAYSTVAELCIGRGGECLYTILTERTVEGTVGSLDLSRKGRGCCSVM